MLAIIIYNEILEKGDNTGIIEISENIVGGIYQDISYKTAAENIGENNILFYIPLTVSGKTYLDRKNDLREKAIEYQNSWYDFCGFSYGEIGDIQAFFENNGRRYGLLTEFRENAIC